MGKRPRIPKSVKAPEPIAPSEGTEDFKKNIASENAKLIYKYSDFEIEIWIDKHYEIRATEGDANGIREGIEQKKVLELIIESVKYIFHFYISNRITAFINFPDRKKPRSKTNYRIVLKDFRNSETPLNLVIEIHLIGYGKYEITTITAMKTNDFYMTDGQYCISFTDSSINLNRLILKNLSAIDKLTY
ncbi:hypothetical protein C1631_022970 [Chryseobacterium phosphatilyticum]|uniref:Uncharacterized protein n=1 Tax=Chryseobacterium phosphatilyticum TaxID=475075 RepID=A0A316WV14_9FLAO|nr:hypothetical protein [Chryseobacterium phosphatilyticum]PWN62430.1 hypothetical protein C1631_022970 [Chryseobacterium phosphatilyticum]